MNDPQPIPTATVLPERDYEAALLGLVLYAGSGEAVETILSELQPGDWLGRGGVHRWTFEAFRTIHRAGKPIELQSAIKQLRTMGRADEVTPAFLTSIVDDGVLYLRDWRHAVKVVRDASTRAALSALCRKTVIDCADPASDAQGVLAALEQAVFAYSRQLDPDGAGLMPISEIISRHQDAIVRAVESGDVDGVRCGFPSIDNLTRGFRPGELIVVAGRTSAGKTAFALNVIRNIVRDGRTVALFSAEMDDAELLRRYLALDSGLDGHQMFSGRLPEREYARIGEAFASIGGWPLWIDPAADLTPGMIRSRARALRAQHGLDLIVVDYLQLLRGDGRRYDTRNGEVADVARSLKVLAKQIGVPILALSQLNREADRVLTSAARGKSLAEIDADQEKTAPPRLSQLAESSELEKAANVVIFLHKPTKITNVYEVDVAKSRNGPTGTVELRWEKACMRFHDDVDRRYEEHSA